MTTYNSCLGFEYVFLSLFKKGYRFFSRCVPESTYRYVWCIWVFFLVGWPSSFAYSKLKYAEDRVPFNLNPIYAEDMYSVRVTELLFERLIGWDKQLQPVPMLATHWKIAKNRKAISLFLRKGVLWHDGKPFHADDVLFTIRAMTHQKSNIQDRYLASIVLKARKQGPHRVKIVFRKPMNKPLRWLQFKIIPKHRFRKKLPHRTHIFSQRPCGTGPFQFVNWYGRTIKLKRFPRHWRKKKTKLKGIKLQVIPDKNVQAQVLRFGGTDVVVRLRPKDVPMFARVRGVNLYPYSTNSWWYLGLNQKRRSVLRDKRVRQALLLALDRDALRLAHLGDGMTITGPFSPNDPLYNFSLAVRNQNLKKARKLLRSAGWTFKKNVWRKGRKVLKLNFVLPKSKTTYKSLVLAIRSQLQNLGIPVKVTWLGDVAWHRQVFTRRSFDIVLHKWNFDSLSSIYPLFHSRGRLNYISYSNPEVDRLLKLSTITTDPLIYKAIYQKIHKKLYAELPYVYLWSLTNYTAVSAKVKNVLIHPFNYFHFTHGWKK